MENRQGEFKILTFNAIDVETANADRASICQIGIVHVRDGEIRDHWKTLIDPEDWFDRFNVGIHGIDEAAVIGSPKLPDVRDELRRRLRGSVLVSHTSFDRVAFERAMERYDLEQLQVTWLDSAKIARRAWPDEFADRGYGLDNVARSLGIEFKHHDALEDARASAEITLRACQDTGLDINDWLSRVKRPIQLDKTARSARDVQSVRRNGDENGPLHGEAIVFTGTLSVSRKVAADTAAAIGCDVVPGVTKKITMLVVGVQDMNRLKGYAKSSKHRKAESLIEHGAEIQILSERDFFDLVEVNKS